MVFYHSRECFKVADWGYSTGMIGKKQRREKSDNPVLGENFNCVLHHHFKEAAKPNRLSIEHKG